MRLLFATFVICMTIRSVEAQSVRLRNVSHPNTHIEVGNTVEVDIYGAHPLATVQVVQNGGAATTMGTTNELGYWSITATESAGDVGFYTQLWYVDGIQMTPDNPDPEYLFYAPHLPSFTVYANFTGTNCPMQSTTSVNCGGTNTARHWIWSPVTYGYGSSGIPFSSITAAAQNWNRLVQNQIFLSSDISQRVDVLIYDDPTIGSVNASTLSYGQDCDTDCHNLIDQCTGTCFNDAAVYYVDIQLNIPYMSNSAVALGLGWPSDSYATSVLSHEFGHALRLAHIPPSDAKCTEVQSVMYASSSVLQGCGITAPNSSCDAGGIYTVYPNPVSYCGSWTRNYCIIGSAECS